MKRKILYVLSLVFACLFAFGCSPSEPPEVDYHATVNSYADGVFVGYDYARENLVQKRTYIDGGYTVDDESLPTSRTIIVRNKSKLTSIGGDVDRARIDFSAQMAIVYSFAEDNERPYYLNKIEVEEGIINVYYRVRYINGDEQRQVQMQRWICVVMDKVQSESVRFIQEPAVNDRGEVGYHAYMHDEADQYLDEQFLADNRVKAYYLDIGWDKTSPETRTFLITDEGDFSSIFTKYEGTVDFDHQMVILYMFSVTNSRLHFLNEVKIEGQKATVYYEEEYLHPDRVDGTMPGRDCMMIVLDKSDIGEVEFICEQLTY